MAGESQIYKFNDKDWVSMTNQEKAIQILNETDKLGILHVGSLGESVALHCIVKALNDKDAKFKEFCRKVEEENIKDI